MAEPRGLAAALAPFHAASKHLQATQARLSALIAAVTSEAVTRTGNLERLPAAARCNPFSVAQPLNPFAVLTKVAGAANAAEAGAKAGGRRSDTGKRAAPTAAARPGANASAAAAGLASAADSLRQAPGRAPDLPPSAAARAAAARAEPDRTLADTARSGAAAAATAGASSADAPSVGALIDALLQRHAATAACPKAGRTPARTARSGTAGAAESSASVQSVSERIDAVLQGPTVAAPEARPTLAHADHAGAAAAAGAGKASAGAPPVGKLIGSLLQRHTAPRPDTRPTESAQPMASAADAGAYLQGAPDTLRTLVAPLFLRPAPDTVAGPAEASAQRPSERLPLLRAPSRLLGTAAPGAQATAAAAATAKGWTTAAEPVSGQPADSPADLAAGLDRLLREQAWLRGVDLT